MLGLNIGSGIHPTPEPGWVNIDANCPEGWKVDVIASAMDLPYPDKCADRVYFGHILEHLSYDVDAVQALREAWRVLKWGGQLGVVGPAMDLAIETEQPEGILDAIRVHEAEGDYGSDTPSGFGHLWEANVNNTFALVKSVFGVSMVVPVDQIKRATGWPNNETSPWQVAIFGSKI